MRFLLFRAALSGCGVAAIFVCSCEKHQVGEYPEVQRDRLLETKHHAPSKAAAPPSATPVDFFPEKTR